MRRIATDADQDVLESRRNQWRTRNAAAGPKTIAQIHEDAARQAQDESRRTASSAGRPRAPDPAPSRGGSRRGQARDAGPDGWSTITPTPPVRPSKAGDISGFGKLRQPTAAATTFGPTGAFAKRGGAAAAARDASPAGGATPSAASNPFAALAGEGSAAPDAATSPTDAAASGGRPRLVLAPRTVPLGDGTEPASAVDEPEDEADEADEEEVEPAMDPEAVARSIKNSVAEWFEIKDVDEALAAFRALPPANRPELVTALATEVLSKKLPDVEKLAALFEALVDPADGDGPAVLTADDYLKAFPPVVADLDDLATDVPKAFEFAARLLVGAKLDEDQVNAVTADMVAIEEGEEEECVLAFGVRPLTCRRVRERLRDKYRSLVASA